jgi:hypothetical protein
MITMEADKPVRTFRFQPEMPEHLSAEVIIGESAGDSTFTQIRLYNENSNCQYEFDDQSQTRALAGEWERQGYFNALSFVLDILRLYGNVKG